MHFPFFARKQYYSPPNDDFFKNYMIQLVARILTSPLKCAIISFVQESRSSWQLNFETDLYADVAEQPSWWRARSLLLVVQMSFANLRSQTALEAWLLFGSWRTEKWDTKFYMRMWRNGRRAGFRFQCWETCGFKSRHPHHGQSLNKGLLFFVRNRICQQPQGLLTYPRDLKVPQSSRIVATSPAVTRLVCSLLCWLRFA